MTKRIKINNANIIMPYQIIHNGCIIIEDSNIAGISHKDINIEDCLLIDAKGLYVSPGFIDIHTHGGGGYDFMDGTAEAFIKAAEIHAIHGTTAMLPTTLTSTMDELKNNMQKFKTAKAVNNRGARLLGLHLEGPYFSMAQRGAQNMRYIKKPLMKEVETILSWSDDVVRWSAAPEIDGALKFARYIDSKGILPSIAHSDATYEQVQLAFENGFRHITHLYSAMSGIHRINGYRYAGVIESAYLIDEMTVEIIADGSHLPSSLLKYVYKFKGADHIALVTDSMRAAGMPEGESILGSLQDGQKVIVEHGVAKLMDRSAFAGSVATAESLVRNMINMADVPLFDAVKMMTLTPASIINMDKVMGSITVGKYADLILFNENIDIKMTIIGGNIVYTQI